MPGSSSWRCLAVACFVVPALLSAASGCRRGEVLDGTPLYAPFNQRKPVAVIRARIAGGRGELVGRSVIDSRLALRIEEIELSSTAGARLIWRPTVAECMLDGRARMRFAESIPGAAAAQGDPVVRGSVIPLDDPGRSIYREWAIIRRPAEVAAIDAELERLSALPPCPG